MVKFFCLKRNPFASRGCDNCWERRDWVPPPGEPEPPVRRSIPRYGNIHKDFYDKLEALPTCALPVRPPSGRLMYTIKWVPGIEIKVDHLRGEIILKCKNKRMRYKFLSTETLRKFSATQRREMANHWEAHPPPPPDRAEALPPHRAMASS